MKHRRAPLLSVSWRGGELSPQIIRVGHQACSGAGRSEKTSLWGDGLQQSIDARDRGPVAIQHELNEGACGSL